MRWVYQHITEWEVQSLDLCLYVSATYVVKYNGGKLSKYAIIIGAFGGWVAFSTL